MMATRVLKLTVVVSASELVSVAFSVQIPLVSQPVNTALVMPAVGNNDKSGLVPKACALAVSDAETSALVNPPSRYLASNKSGTALEFKPALAFSEDKPLVNCEANVLARAGRLSKPELLLPPLPPPQALNAKTVLKTKADEKVRWKFIQGFSGKGYEVIG
jgi:hypothetical protein